MIKVIIVDDERWNRDLIRAFGQWEQLGLEIVGEANNGEEAINLMEQFEPHIVITDMKMPGVTGTQLMQYISAHYPNVLTIVISGYDDFEYARQAIKYSAVEYLLKPIDAMELNDVLERCKENIVELSMINLNPILDIELSYTFHSYEKQITTIFEQLDQGQLDKLFQQVAVDFEQINNENVYDKLLEQWIVILHQLINDFSIQLELVNAQVIPATMNELLHDVHQQYTTALQALIIQRKYKNKLPIQEVKKYITTHANNNITLEEIASRFYVSKEYLSKIFKQEYGVNITDYIVQLRMELAHYHLTESAQSIKEIAELVGYEDVSYFYRVFRKHFGIAPGEMRKSTGLK
ncbi:MAG TPA: response regulator [Candidatus Paenibacillus intestinavium]|nr:response regulator [Candidatus Paenibacillus intestinavium]